MSKSQGRRRAASDKLTIFSIGEGQRDFLNQPNTGSGAFQNNNLFNGSGAAVLFKK